MERSGIILAAGDGRRLRPFIQQLRGDALPKQYVRFGGRRSLLEQTIRRAELLIPPDRLFTVVGRHHLAFREAVLQLTGRPPGTVIIQPANKDTGPGILLPLLHLTARHPEAVVAIFPSDHSISEEALFMGYVDLACRVVEQDPAQLVLLGVEPQAPEPEYGYIVPGRRLMDGVGGVKRVVRFVEKPDLAEAEQLIDSGALWNTFVMVVQGAALLDLIRRLAPGLYQEFSRFRQAIGSGEEQAAEEVYRTVESLNFSREVLERMMPTDPLRVTVLPVRGVSWSDWGSEQRLVTGLLKTAAARGTGPLYFGPPAEGTDLKAEKTM
ncbi:MAG TPA: sugar phosphate nucleotidyltransferase [Nitrospiria bacterium]|nr:sugar phosphate nucleotidyltransferase [Nitrospiria bacterium]